GEIDIVEGVNDQGSDLVSLHTSPDCSMPASPTGLDCDTAATGNAGCGVQITEGNNYGPSFNAKGGGCGSGATPADVAKGAGSINTDNWGTPDAYFPNTQCDIGAHFGPASLIINIDLCGDWAGNVYSSSGCPGTGAFFEFSWIKVYQ
ncbi:hypothetical protein EI94DRAFT_1731468, partial [Lactarius quietus]